MSMINNNNKTMSKKKLLVYILIILLGIYGTYQYFKPKNDIVYMTQKVERANIENTVSATGEIGAEELVDVGAQVSGEIQKLYVELGQKVKKGDLIAQIDSTTQQNEVDINKAKLESYKIQLQSAKVSFKVASQQYERAKKLIKSNAISKESLEDFENAYATAKSNLSQIESLLKQTEISLSTAETNLGYTKISAPMDGTIVSIPVEEGQTVNSAMTTPTIVQIADLTKMEILMEISEADVIKIKPGLKVSYNTLGSSKKYETTLKSIDPGLTLLTNGEYTGVVGSDEAVYYYGRLQIPNEDGKLRIGMTTENTIYIDSAYDVLTVPTMAVYKKGDDLYVKILKDGNEVEERKIEPGIANNTTLEVKSGVSEGEEVILASLSSEEIDEKVNKFARR